MNLQLSVSILTVEHARGSSPSRTPNSTELWPHSIELDDCYPVREQLSGIQLLTDCGYAARR